MYAIEGEHTSCLGGAFRPLVLARGFASIAPMTKGQLLALPTDACLDSFIFAQFLSPEPAGAFGKLCLGLAVAQKLPHSPPANFAATFLGRPVWGIV